MPFRHESLPPPQYFRQASIACNAPANLRCVLMSSICLLGDVRLASIFFSRRPLLAHVKPFIFLDHMNRRYTKPLLFRHGTRAGIDHSNPIRRSLTGPLNTIPTSARLCRKKIGLHQCSFLSVLGHRTYFSALLIQSQRRFQSSPSTR